MDFLKQLGIEPVNSGGCAGDGWWSPIEDRKLSSSINPATGEEIAKVAMANEKDYERIVAAGVEAFKTWRMVPAPKRGLVVRDIGEALREKKEPLGQLVSLEMGRGHDQGFWRGRR